MSGKRPTFLAMPPLCCSPICWPEPFGLVIIEAMACGTPVIAFRHGSVPEVIEEGITGFVVDSHERALSAIASLAIVDRHAVRAHFERRFTARRMAEDYVGIYKKVIEPSSREKRESSLRLAVHTPQSSPENA